MQRETIMNDILDFIKTKRNETTNRPFLIAIDGMCGSGKTTLGLYLAKELNASLFHMDDFFLQPHQRTAARLSEPGGNVDYERFKAEVLDHVADESGVTFRLFNCQEWKLADKPITVPYNNIIIVEGSYSHHPYFEDVYDVKLFLEISPEEQKKRIIARDGEAIWPMFEKKWIPMENRYFKEFEILANANLVSYLNK